MSKYVVAIAAFAASLVGGLQADDRPTDTTAGVPLAQEGLAEHQAGLAKRIAAAPAGAMKGCGLAGAMGEARVRVTSANTQEILLPIPQFTGGQVPICYFVSGTPADAVTEFRLRKRDDDNVVLAVRLAGKKQEVRIAWSAVVLLAPHHVTPDRTPEKPYKKATACVQTEADAVKKLAGELWPDSGKAAEFAVAIQKHVRGMKRADRPRSLDAAGILRSGENGICTANANLAAALLRSKGIACRSVAVIPPTGQRLEMHRVAAYVEDGNWLTFDPSSLHPDVPAKSWQNIVMARTTVADEEVAMKPRMGVMLGCPYGQEIELLTREVNLFGADFFWTTAVPLAEFDAAEETARLAAKAWGRTLETGTLTKAQLKAGSARTAAEWADSLKDK